MTHRFVLLSCLLGVVACDGGVPAARDAAVPADGAAPRDDAGARDSAAAPLDAVAPMDAPAEEIGTFELPRLPADPKLTRLLVPGDARLVGGDFASCTHARGATTDRWCAFSRPGTSPMTTELWVLNMTQALAGAAPPCDGTSAGCIRITSALWTATPLYGAFHPAAHRFEADTLLFHADAAPGSDNLFRGPVWAWRPGWKAPRKLTSDEGLLCFGEHESTAVMCVDAAVVEKNPNNPFDPPRITAFDLRAGILDAEPTAPLPLVTHVVPANAAPLRARFSKDGATFAFSTTTAGMPETLFVIKTADIGRATPQPILTDASEWEIAHDDQKVYFLRGYDSSQGSRANGTLMLADFPTGANPTELLTRIVAFELLGAREEYFSRTDRGLLLAYAGTGESNWLALMLDRTKPTELHRFGNKASIAQVSTDARHTIMMIDVRGGEFPSAYVNHSDSSGQCRLTADYRAETYGLHFSDSARLAFWIEFGRNQSQSEEGWYANAETCGERVKFGDFVRWYTVLGDDLVLFEGGDLDDSTRWLEYTSLRASPAGTPNHPRVIQERTDGIVSVLRNKGAAWAIYTVGGPEAPPGATPGLFAHGPLTQP